MKHALKLLPLALLLLAAPVWASGGTFVRSGAMRMYFAAGTCQDDVVSSSNALCLGSADPFACCTGAGAGTCYKPITLPQCALDGTLRGFTLGTDAYPQDVAADSEFTCVLYYDSPDADISGAFTAQLALQVTMPAYSTFKGEDIEVANFVATAEIANQTIEDLNAACSGSGTPASCCTGSGTGTCLAMGTVTFPAIIPKGSSYTERCSAADTPWDCCTGDGTGTCPIACTNTTPMDCRSAPLVARILVGTNDACTATDVPFDCCTGADTGTCGASTNNLRVIALRCSYE
jgi:hypothetical protein